MNKLFLTKLWPLLAAFAVVLGSSTPLASVSSARADSPSWTEQTSAGSFIWQSVASSSDGTKLVLAAQRDTNFDAYSIFTSRDSGSTWTEQTSAGYAFWDGVASSSDGTKLVAVSGMDRFGNPGSIFTSSDSGATWNERLDAGKADWYSVASNSDGTKLVAVSNGDGYGNPGSIFTSTNSGETWTEQTSPGKAAWYNVTSNSDGSKLAAVSDGGDGNAGSIYTSADSGATWIERTSAGYAQWRSVALSSDGTKLVAVSAFEEGGLGYIYTSIDSGENWTRQSNAGNALWISVASSDDGTKLIACSIFDMSNPGRIFTSTDSGATWTQETSAGQASWLTVASNSDGTKLVAASNFDSSAFGSVWTYSSGGASPAPAPTITSVSPPSGAISGGTQITVTGTGFVDGARVTVGGDTCSNVIVVSANSITCVTPYLSPPTGSAGAKDVVVTNADNQVTGALSAFTYVAAPTFTSVSPASGPVAGGTRITITGAGFVAGDTVTLNGARGLLGSCTSVNVLSSTSLRCLTPAGQVGPADINVNDVYGQNALGTEAFTYLGSKFSASTPSTLSLQLGSKSSTLQTVTVTNTGNTPLKFGVHSVTETGADVSSFTLLSDRCSRRSVLPNNTCSVGYRFYPSRVGNHTANLVFASNASSSSDSVEIAGIGLPKKISTVVISRIKATSGRTSGGTAVTITGSGFNSEATVTIGGQNATIIKRRGSTTITVSTPAHAAGKVLVAVTNPDSGTDSYNGFTYVQ